MGHAQHVRQFSGLMLLPARSGAQSFTTSHTHIPFPDTPLSKMLAKCTSDDTRHGSAPAIRRCRSIRVATARFVDFLNGGRASHPGVSQLCIHVHIGPRLLTIVLPLWLTMRLSIG